MSQEEFKTAPIPVVKAEEIIPVPTSTPPATHYGEDQLEQRYNEGIEEGKRLAKAELESQESELNKKIADTLETISINIALSLTEFEQHKHRQSHDLANIAVAIAKKIVPTLSAEDALKEVMDVAEKCLEIITQEPEITITVNPLIAETLKEHITTHLQEKGFKGQLIVRGNDTLVETDCRIEWQNGMAESSRAQMFEEIEKVISTMKSNETPTS